MIYQTNITFVLDIIFIKIVIDISVIIVTIRFNTTQDVTDKPSYIGSINFHIKLIFYYEFYFFIKIVMR